MDKINLYFNMFEYTSLMYRIKNQNVLTLDEKDINDINKINAMGWTSLMYAINNKDYPLCKLLIENGADVNLFKESQSPMHLAIRTRRSKIVKLLIENGFDFKSKKLEYLKDIRELSIETSDIMFDLIRPNLEEIK
jgi:ankyrin repeat protein